MVYQWKIENKYPVDAQIAGETIEQITRANGKGYIEAEDLLEASKPENAPLHSCFEWDNDKAAEKFRLNQSREIIANIITVTVKNSNEVISEPVRAFVSFNNANCKGKFIAIESAMKNTDYREQVLKNALFELRNFKQKYNAYSELSKVFSAIDSFADSLKV